MTYAVIFDLDGTLIDTPRAIVETFTAAFAALGIPVPETESIRATIGLPLEQAFGKLIGVPPDEARVVACVEQYQIGFKEYVLPGARKLVFPGVADGLTALGGLGVLLAVATSKYYRSADALLTAAGVRSHFDMVVGVDQVTQPKPHPEMGQVIMQALGVATERAVMVGDTTHDLLMARAAGMRSIAVTYGVHSVEVLKTAYPTWTADSFEDVLRYIREAIDEPDEEGDSR